MGGETRARKQPFEMKQNYLFRNLSSNGNVRWNSSIAGKAGGAGGEKQSPKNVCETLRPQREG